MKTYTMYHYLFLVASFFATISLWSQETISWGPAISVADGTTFGNIRPRLTLTTNDQPIVVFGKNGTGRLFVAKGNGSSFSTPVDILPANLGTYLANWTGPDIAAYGDTVIAVFKALPFDEGKVFIVRSTDGGLTFSDTIRVDDHDTGRCFMPALTIDNAGNPIVDYMIFDGSSDNPRYAVAQSNDAGLTFLSGVEASTVNPGEACDCCPAEMVTDGTYQVLLYRNNTSNIRDIYAASSTDGGATFSLGGDLEALQWFINSCPSTGPHGVIVGDSLFSVAASDASGNYRVNISSIDLNTNLSIEQQVAVIPPTNMNGGQNYPRISGENDTLVLVWEEKETSNPEVFCSVITNGNIAAFSSYKSRVNEITTGVQTNPDIVYKNGFAHIVYQDAASGDVIYRKGTVFSVAGINSIDLNAISVYPNPSSDGVFHFQGLSNAEQWKGTVADLAGNAIASQFVVAQDGVQLILHSTVKNGLYFLAMENSAGDQLTLRLSVAH